MTILLLVMIVPATYTIDDFNIYSDFITHSEIQIYIYNTSMTQVFIQDVNNTISDTNTTLQKVNDNSKVFHSTIDNNKLINCENNTYQELTVTNCKLSLNNQDGGKIATFSLMRFNYDNITQTMIDFANDNNFMAYPSMMEKYIQFKECKDSTCLEDVQLHPRYNEYTFKLNVQPNVRDSYDFALIRSYMTVKLFGKIVYFLDVRQMLKQENFVYNFGLDIFPDEFDLYMVYQVRKTGDGNTVKIFIYLATEQ
jgi:hypothetical protein